MADRIVHEKYRGSKAYFLAYSALITVARYQGTITYRGIALLAGLPDRGNQMSKEVGHLLGEISEDEVDSGRPMLSALGVEKGTGKPSFGFFKLARHLGKLKGTSKAAERKFWDQERNQLYQIWE